MGLFGKLVAAMIQTTTIPVAIIKDVATLGGVVNEGYFKNNNHTYTGKRLKEIGETIEETIDDLKR